MLNGIFGESEVMGVYLARLSPLLFGLFFLNKDLVKKHFYKYLFLFLNTTALIFLTGDRSEFFLSIISLFLIILFIDKFKNLKFLIIFSSLLILCSTFLLNADFKYRYIDNVFENITEGGSNIFFLSPSHDAMMKSSFKMFLENPLFGQGTKTYRELCGVKEFKIIIDGFDADDPRGHACSTHPHSWYLELLAENGIIGFILIFLIFLEVSSLLLRHFISMNLNKKYIYESAKVCFLITIFINFLPLVPSLSFFNNWGSVITFLSIAFYIFSQNVIKK